MLYFERGFIMHRTATKDTRLDFRLPNDIKHNIEKAACILGLTTSAFVLTPAIERAQKVLQETNNIFLTEKEHDHFMALLENPPKPNKNLKKLFKKYSRQ